MMKVLGGDFLMGSHVDEDEDRPLHRVRVDEFYIDQFEVTQGAYKDCVDAGKCEAPAEGGTCNWESGKGGDYPANCVSWYDAERFCDWAGKRLPTEAEWEKAARGIDGRRFPWGNGAADCERAVIGFRSLGCGRQETWPVGSRPAGISPYGVHDMIGNVWEWTVDGFVMDEYETHSRDNPVQGNLTEYKVLRGNSWYYSEHQNDSRASNRFRFRPLRWYPYIGFRCVRSDRPSPELEVDPAVQSIKQASKGIADWWERNLAARAAEGEQPFAGELIEPVMIQIPAGSFKMGSNVESDEIPTRDVFVDEFSIDKYEVTVAQYLECVEAGGCEPFVLGKGAFIQPYEWDYCNYGQPGKENHPMNCVNWFEADRFCRWADKRLPTEAEWEKAARGTDGRRFPWGDEQATCDHIVMDIGGDGCGRESTWPVGSKPMGASPYGVMDMSGNVWEWVADWYAYDFYRRGQDVNPFNAVQEPDPRLPDRTDDKLKIQRGGSWADQSTFIHRSANRLAYLADTHPDYTSGFRCAKD
jgi:formylglycine-generating enzyme required for sulfatase activity